MLLPGFIKFLKLIFFETYFRHLYQYHTHAFQILQNDSVIMHHLLLTFYVRKRSRIKLSQPYFTTALILLTYRLHEIFEIHISQNYQGRPCLQNNFVIIPHLFSTGYVRIKSVQHQIRHVNISQIKKPLQFSGLHDFHQSFKKKQ